MNTLTAIAATVLLCCALNAEPSASKIQNEPPLSMREAIEIGEQYLANKEIDVSNKFLSSARYVHTALGPREPGSAKVRSGFYIGRPTRFQRQVALPLSLSTWMAKLDIFLAGESVRSMTKAMRTAIPIILLALGSTPCHAQNDVAEQAVETILAANQSQLDFNAGTQAVLQALASLALTQGLDPDTFTTFCFESGSAAFSGGAVSERMTTDGAEFILVVQTVKPMSMPGTSAQQLLLLSRDGKILDRFQCHINSRYGRIVPVIHPEPESDGSQITIRFEGRGTHNWHTLRHAGVEATFHDHARRRLTDRDEKSEWDVKGLARIAIRPDRFDLIFPQMKTEAQKDNLRLHERTRGDSR